MRSSILSAAVVLAGLNMVNGQTFTDCDPTKKTCPSNPGLGTTVTYDFTKSNDDWKEADGTTLKYGSDGAEFTISKKTDAPTIGTNKYIFFGKVSVTMKASPGKGTVSSFILESDDLDEIDWEWLGADDGNVQSNFFGKGDTTTYDRGATHPVSQPIETYLTYSIDWTKDAIKWYIGDNLVRTLTYDDPKAQGGTRYPQTPMRVKMGSWIGCADAAAETADATKWTCQWAGGAIDLTQGPYTMFVKSVTIEDYGCGGEYSYSDLSGSYTSIKSTGTCDGKADDTTTSSSTVASSSTKKTSSSAASSTTKSGGVLIETESSISTKSSTATGTGSAASATASASASGSGSASTTLATTVAPSTSTGATGTAASATTSAPAQVTANAGNVLKPKHKYGMLDVAVMALGLGLGYLVM